jgi:Holliday junction DNA helicase RuvA
MYAYIRGKLIQATPTHATLEAGGIGYLIAVPANLFAQLPGAGAEVLMYTSLQVREDSQTLYGFLSSLERDLFEVIIGVSGIGPKTGLNVIGHLPPHELHEAIAGRDIATLCKVPGIGKKTAERLILDLRDKIDSAVGTPLAQFAIALPKDPATQRIQDAMGALINLGYNQITAQKAIKKTLQEISEDADLAALISAALKNV